MEILRDTGIDADDLHIITKLYWHQTPQVRVNRITSEQMTIQKSVRQDNVLSSLLFSIYSEAIILEVLEDVDISITIHRKVFNQFCYAADTVVIADQLKD